MLFCYIWHFNTFKLVELRNYYWILYHLGNFYFEMRNRSLSILTNILLHLNFSYLFIFFYPNSLGSLFLWQKLWETSETRVKDNLLVRPKLIFPFVSRKPDSLFKLLYHLNHKNKWYHRNPNHAFKPIQYTFPQGKTRRKFVSPLQLILYHLLLS